MDGYLSDVTHKVYVAARNPLVVPQEADADLVVDDLIDLFRDNDSVVFNNQDQAILKVKDKSGHVYSITIEKII